MSKQPETLVQYNQRKLKEIREMIDIAIAHPIIVNAIKITDGTTINQQNQSIIPLIVIDVGIKESMYHELKKQV